MVSDSAFPTEWSAIARSVATATDRGMRAAHAHDLDELIESVEVLDVVADKTRTVHGQMVRELLETAYADGVSGDDVSDVLTGTVAGAGEWNAPVNPAAVVLVLTGALGVSEDLGDGGASGPPVSDSEIITAALLVAVHLAAIAEVDHRAYVKRAVEEIRRAQTVEMP